jgi:hypothetical protein
MSATRIRPAVHGSVSSGTLNSYGLLSSFARELHYQLGRQSRRFKRRPYRKLINEAWRLLSSRDGDAAARFAQYPDAEGYWLIDELQHALGDFAPSLSYFGSHECDGADFGYWVSSFIYEDFDGLRVSDLSEVPAKHTGDVLLVNDHGNMSLYSCRRGKLKENWAIV